MNRGGIGGEGGDESRGSGSKPAPGKGSVFSDKRGSIVTARGTGEGLVLRLDSRVSEVQLIEALSQYVESRQSFLEGNSISLEWVGGRPADSTVLEVEGWLETNCSVSISEISGSNDGAKVMRLADRVESETQPSTKLGLFGGIEGIDMSEGTESEDFLSAVDTESSAMDIASWDDPDARIVYRTLRSGQKIETEHSLIVIGDVNSGAELVAGGDIIVLGSLRGVAHAGAYDETGGGRFIVSTDLQPTQLRIGSIISRGSGEARGPVMEIARVDGNLIIVEPFNARTITGLKR